MRDVSTETEHSGRFGSSHPASAQAGTRQVSRIFSFCYTILMTIETITASRELKTPCQVGTATRSRYSGWKASQHPMLQTTSAAKKSNSVSTQAPSPSPKPNVPRLRTSLFQKMSCVRSWKLIKRSWEVVGSRPKGLDRLIRVAVPRFTVRLPKLILCLLRLRVRLRLFRLSLPPYPSLVRRL